MQLFFSFYPFILITGIFYCVLPPSGQEQIFFCYFLSQGCCPARYSLFFSSTGSMAEAPGAPLVIRFSTQVFMLMAS